MSNCVHGLKYASMEKDGLQEWKRQAGFLYSDDVSAGAQRRGHDSNYG